MKIYLLLFISLFVFFGCAKKQNPLPKKTKTLQASTLVEQKVVIDPNFNKENLTQENTSNKVFKNCFKTGSKNLEKICKTQIDKFLKASILKNKRIILIEVHTDKGGSDKKNLAISIKRAQKIAASLYYKEYKNSQVYYKGFGESKLIYDLSSVDANTENRRVIIKLRPKTFKVNTKRYTAYKKPKHKTIKKENKRKKSEVYKKQKLQITKYTGQADIGWIYFGKYNLAKKLTISCRDDKPRKEKHKAISRGKKKEFMSTFYNRKINGSYSGGEIEVSPIYIYENGKLPISNPILALKQKNKEVIRFQTTINTYRGKKGILYRIFVNGKKDVSCVDLVISYKDDKVSYGRIYTKDKREFKLTNLK